jgi:putative transposase
MRKQHYEDYESIEQKVVQQIRSGKPLMGKGGALAPLIEHFVKLAMEAEVEGFLDDGERQRGNRRNGYQETKTVKTGQGSFDVRTPRDRFGEYDPQIIKKRETIITESMEEKIIALYAQGNSLRDIADHIEQIYDTEISTSTISAITNKVIPHMQEWQNRPLESVYCVVWLDGMHYRVKEDGRVVDKCVYNILGVNTEGMKEILGMYIAGSEGAHFWLSVLSNLQQRGVTDILIACIDGLKGFAEAIASIFPKTDIQSCIVHQVRHSIQYVSNKDRIEFTKDMKTIYQAVTLDEAERNLMELNKKWNRKYSAAVSSWERNWHKLSAFFKYPAGIRKLIYTTNTIESYHRQVRAVTKTKGAWESDTALLKMLYLASRGIHRRWSKHLHNWQLMVAQMAIIFGDRITLRL